MLKLMRRNIVMFQLICHRGKSPSTDFSSCEIKGVSGSDVEAS